MASHMWERWDAPTTERMVDELLTHGNARAQLVNEYITENT